MAKASESKVTKEQAAVIVAVTLQRELSALAPDTYGSQRDAEKTVGAAIAKEMAA
jgi:hypothetical protein